MSTLVVLLPPRPRLHAGHASPTGGAAEFDYVLGDDGLGVAREGRAAPALLPRADQLVAVLPAADLSWHRISCPRAAGAKLAAALAGLLEEALLDDPQQLHFALAPGARGGDETWIAATDRAALRESIAALEAGGQRVERVVPAAWPDSPPRGRFHGGEGDAPLRLTWSHADGVLSLPLAGSQARALLPEPPPDDAHFSATPAAAQAAGHWLGHSLAVQTEAEAALHAARSLWNLRQFDLAPRHRGLDVLREAGRRFLGPAWRPARWGLAGLVAVQLLGLNLAAWQQDRAFAERKAELSRLLTATHPQVRAVYDPAAQMQRETDLLRAAAGRAGDADLEAALQAAASAWPPASPVQVLRFEGGKLSLAADWPDEEVEAFRAALAPSGWQVEAGDGRLTLQRGAATPGAGT